MKNSNVKRSALAVLATGTFVGVASTSVFASGTSEIMKPLNNFNSLLFDLVAGVGTAALIFGFIMLGLSFYSHDASQRVAAIWAIVGGILFVSIRLVIAFITGG